MVPIGAIHARRRLIADSQFGGGATTWAPATWYAGLSVTISNADGTNFTEPSGGAYTRVGLANNNTNFPPATTDADLVTRKLLGVPVTWPDPTGNWGLLVELGWFTASTGGVPAYTFRLLTEITAQAGNTPVQVPIGQLVSRWG